MTNKKALVVAFSLLFSLIWPSATTASTVLENGQLPMNQRQFQETEPLWILPTPATPQLLNYTVRGGMDTIGAPSAISTDHGLCAQVDSACLENTTQLFMRGYFGDCNKGDPAPCIKSLAARKAGDSTWTEGKITEQIDYKPSQSEIRNFVNALNQDTTAGTVQDTAGIGTSFPSNKEAGTYAGASGPISFEIPGILNAAGTDQYLVDSRYEINYLVSGNKPASGVLPQFVAMSVRPFANAPFGTTPVQGYRYNATTKHGGITGSVGSDYSTAYVVAGRTGLAAGFPSGYQFRLQVEVPTAFAAWYHGRIDNPEVQLTPESGGSTFMEIVGSPVYEPTTSATVTPDNPDFMNLNPDTSWLNHMKDLAAKGILGSTGTGWRPVGGIDALYLKWAKLFPEKAKGVGTVWSLTSMDGGQVGSNQCLGQTNSLQGLLFTNAMAYKATTPTFESGTLKYQVAGVHYDSNGEIFRGNYTFKMKDSVARCLYNFSNAPISGTVSVTSADGQEQVAYTNVSDENGWLTLTAQGFTFSNPVISAKLTQTAVPVASTPLLARKVITCIKGKLTKKVAGTAPKCPSGYKTK